MKTIVNKTKLAAIVCGCLLTLLVSPVQAEIPVDSYCQLVILSMEKVISQVQEIISIVQQYKDNPELLDQQLVAKWSQFDQDTENLCALYGTTTQEYVTYENRNKEAVESYLAENESLKKTIDNLSVQLNQLMEQEAALRPAENNTPSLPIE